MAAVTVIFPTGSAPPFQLGVPWIEVKADWSSPWTFDPRLRLVRASHSAAGGGGIASMELERRYGTVKQPWETAFSTVSQADLTGYWVRMSLAFASGFYTTFVGQISTEVRDVFDVGDPADPSRVLSGVQRWVARSPQQILDTTEISRSWWQDDQMTESDLGWLPDMNARDERGLLVGNRSDEPSLSGEYLYGGTARWNRRQYLEYVLARFVGQAAGPNWRLAGGADVLEQFEDHVRLGDVVSAGDVCRRLIESRLGLDYIVQPVSDGFELYVYELSAQAWSFGGATTPANPFTVELEAPLAKDVEQLELVSTRDQARGRIRVIGRRIVTCATLRGDDGSLVGKWTPDQEAAYKAGTGDPNDPEEEHEAVRRQDRFRAVYQQFGAPDDWDANAGTAAPKLDELGQPAGDGASRQKTVRSTLPWLPMRESIDYSVDPPDDANPDGYEPEQLPAQVWLKFNYGLPVPSPYLPADEVDVGVHVAGNDWGFLLQSSPNHRLARNHFDGAFPLGSSALSPLVFDYEEIVATIAFETDQRLELLWEGPDAANDPTEKVIEVPDAEYWFVPAGTVVGVDVPGVFRAAPKDLVLRDDGPRLAAVMAGALARYAGPRHRASLVLRGLLPWSDLVGRILSTVQQGNDLVDVLAPITSVEWVAGPAPKTIVRAGFA